MADNNIDFTFRANGLTVVFKDRSTTVAEIDSYLWDFGDGQTSNEQNPTYTYTNIGLYDITLTVSISQLNVKTTRTIAISDIVETTLSGSIYELIDEYIPKAIFGNMSFQRRHQYIQKWQFYLGPLINREIAIQNQTDELYYEALENQLVMELATYDWVTVRVQEMLQANAESIIKGNLYSSTDDENQTTTGGSTDIKKIVTGPTEIEYHNSTESNSKSASMITKALAPGGIIDTMKYKLCMLAERLDIYLPICRNIQSPIIPVVVNRRNQGGLNGPNPRVIVNK